MHIFDENVVLHKRTVELTERDYFDVKWRRNKVCCCYPDDNEHQVESRSLEFGRTEVLCLKSPLRKLNRLIQHVQCTNYSHWIR